MASLQSTTGKVSRRTIDAIFNSLKVALATKCDELLFDDFGISGRAIETNIVIIQPLDGNEEFEFEAMGIGRIPELYARMKLIIDEPDLSGEYVEFREGKVGKLVLKTKKTKIEFRCKDPAMIKTNKKLKDPIHYSFNLNADAIRFMTSGTAAMKNKSVTFKLQDGKVFIRLIDAEGDILDHEVTSKVTIDTDADGEEFSHSYDMPKLAPLLNAHKENTTVNITRRGIMNLSSEGFNIYLVADL